MMLSAVLLFLFVININSQIDVELGYLRLAKKMIRFEFTSFEHVTGLNSKNVCCSGAQLPVCRQCSSIISIVRQDITGVPSTTSVGSYTNSSRANFFITRAIIIDPSEYFSYQVYQFESIRGEVLDTWYNFSTDLIGTYTMNGVWGIYGNVILSYAVDIIPLESYSSYYAINFHVYRVTWSRKEYSDGSCCQTSNSSSCDLSCAFITNVYANDVLGFTFNPSSYVGSNSSYFVKLAGGTTSSLFRTDNVRVRLTVVGASNGKLIDEFRLPALRAIPNRMVEFNGIEGSYGKLRMDFNLKFECSGYNGYNCRFYCTNYTRFIDCHFERGDIFCSNGASDPPTCRTFNNTCFTSPCINGGICSPLPSGFNCICPRGFRGKYCEEPNCKNECKRGNCVNNKCVCDPSYEGDFCDTASCSAGLAKNCQNGGVCKVIDGETKCVCPAFTAGEFCELPVCTNQCQVGTCSFINNQLPIRAACTCTNGFSGDSCDIRPLLAVFGTDTIYIVVITVLVILLVIIMKTFFVLCIVKFETPKIVKSQSESDPETKRARPNSIVGL